MNHIDVMAADISLFHVAMKSLGDPLQWWRVAQSNGMSDPDLSDFISPISIVIPMIDASSGDLSSVSGV